MIDLHFHRHGTGIISRRQMYDMNMISASDNDVDEIDMEDSHIIFVQYFCHPFLELEAIISS